jgi:beta-lactam-binding protein with PASTA domain
MGTGRYPERALDEDARTSTEETTLAEGEWPVAEQYRIEPAEPPADGRDTVVLRQEPPADAEPPRRFPPEVGRGLALGLLATLLVLLLIPAGFWLASRSDDDSTSATDTNTFETTTQPPGNDAERTVADVTGRQLAEARELLEERGLRVRFRRVESDRPRDEVLSQTPRPGADAVRGSLVVLTVSGGQERVAVPNVVGMTERDAIDQMTTAGLESRVRPVPSDERAGTVVAQDPAAGQEVPDGAVVTLEVSEVEEAPPPPSEPATVRVPNVVGTRSADARSRLRSIGLRPTQRPVESQRPAGTVLSQSPGPGAELREGGIVTLTVSTGPARVEVPDVVGLGERAAARELERAGFAVRLVDETTLLPTEDGVVLRQNPSAGTSRRTGSTVTVTVGRFVSG